MTIPEILRGLPALKQYSVLQWADVEFSETAGRYFGGPLTPRQETSVSELLT